MKTTFHDASDSSSPDVILHTAEEITALLNQLRQRKPAIYHLYSENGQILSFGVGENIGRASYSNPSDSPRLYEFAVGDGSVKGTQDFLQAGYYHETKEKHCLSYSVLEQIAIYFVETGQKCPCVEWDKV